LWGIVVKPRATLEYLSERGGRTWWLPTLLVVICATLPVFVAAPITARQSREAVAAMQEQFGEATSPEQQAQMDQAMTLAASPLITVVFPAITSVVGLVVGWLIWGGALHLTGMMLGGRSTFGQVFRMVMWAWIPYGLRGLLQAVYILASGQLIANPGLSGLVANDRPLSEMVVSPPGPGQMILTAFLSRLDLFLVWNLILLVIGVNVTTHLSKRKAVLVTVGVWLLLTALSLVPTLVSGLFARQMSIP